MDGSLSMSLLRPRPRKPPRLPLASELELDLRRWKNPDPDEPLVVDGGEEFRSDENMLFFLVGEVPPLELSRFEELLLLLFELKSGILMGTMVM